MSDYQIEHHPMLGRYYPKYLGKYLSVSDNVINNDIEFLDSAVYFMKESGARDLLIALKKQNGANH